MEVSKRVFLQIIVSHSLFLGSKPIPALERLPRLQLRYLPEPPKILGFLPFILSAPVKIALQIISILFVLLVQIAKPPEFILVQVCPDVLSQPILTRQDRIRPPFLLWHWLGSLEPYEEAKL